jgi:hypothetical protein
MRRDVRACRAESWCVRWAVVRYSQLINNFTAINITKLDVLTGLDTVKIGAWARVRLPPHAVLGFTLAGLARQASSIAWTAGPCSAVRHGAHTRAADTDSAAANCPTGSCRRVWLSTSASLSTMRVAHWCWRVGVDGSAAAQACPAGRRTSPSAASFRSCPRRRRCARVRRHRRRPSPQWHSRPRRFASELPQARRGAFGRARQVCVGVGVGGGGCSAGCAGVNGVPRCSWVGVGAGREDMATAKKR